jgi:hypothetical protein
MESTGGCVMGAKVLNGEVEVGDTVAIGVRDGNSGGIRIGRVLEVKYQGDRRQYDYEAREYRQVPVYSLKIKVTLSSEYRYQDSLDAAPPRWYGTGNVAVINVTA